MRRHLSLLVGVWLVCQVVGLAAASAQLADTPTTSRAQQKCTCPPGASPSEDCPMHHSHEGSQGSQGSQGKRECALKNAFSSTDAALLSLLSSLGLIQPALRIPTTNSVADPVAQLASVLVARPDRPESPPPRT